MASPEPLLSEYIAALNELLEEHGDLRVMKNAYDGPLDASCGASLPKLGYRKILSKREYREKFWSRFDPENLCGEPVIRV